MYHIFFIHSSVDGYLGGFHVLAIMNSATVNICSNMGGPGDYHTKYIRQRQISYNIAYMWNLKNDTNGLIHKTEIDP